MTAGSWCYIGPQGIVHGTTITILNAGRKYLGIDDGGARGDGSEGKEVDVLPMRGTVFVTAGLGGMSGAQPKVSMIL